MAVLLVAIFLRLYSLDSVPPWLMVDEAENELDALAIIEGERPVFLPENHGREALFIYLQAISLALLGQTDFALRIVSAVMGILTIGMAYLLARRMFDSRIALLSCGWLSISLWHVIFSRIGLRTISLPLFLAVGFYCIWRGLEGLRAQAGESQNVHSMGTRHWPAIWFALGGLVIGLSLHTYSIARFAPLVLVAVAVYLGVLHNQWFRQALPGLVLAMSLTVLVFLPLGVFFLNDPESFMERARIVWVFNPELNEGSPIQALFDSVIRSIGMFAVQGDSNLGRNIPGRPIFDPLTALLGLIGTVLAVRRFRQPAYGFTLIWLVLMFVPNFLAIEFVPNFLRATGLIPALFVLPALGAVWLWQAWESRASSRLRGVPILIVTLAFLVGAISTYHSYFEVWVKAPESEQVFTVDRQVPAEVYCRTAESQHEPKDVQDAVRSSSSANPFTVPEGMEPELSIPTRFGEEVIVYGFDLPKNVRAGETITVRWYWRIISADGREFAFTNQLFGEDDSRHGQADARCFVPSYWSIGTLGISTLSFQVDSEASTGAYWLRAAIYDRTRREPKNLPVVQPQGTPSVDHLMLGPIKVKGRTPVQAPVVENPISVSFADHIDLVGYSLSDRNLVPGDSLDLTLIWSPRAKPSKNYGVFVHLLDSQEKVRGRADSSRRFERYPTSMWDAGEVVVDTHTLSLGRDLPADRYRLAIGLYDLESGQPVGVVDETGQTEADHVVVSGLVVER